MKQISITIIILAFSFTSAAQNVGIGELTPTEARLQVRAGDSALLLLHSNPRPQLGNTNPIKTGLFFKAADSYSGSVATIGLGNSYRLGFFTNAGSTPDVLAERMSISDAGNVGIGNISPTYKLDITGNLRTTSNAQIGGLLTANNGLSVVGSAAVSGAVTAGGAVNASLLYSSGGIIVGGSAIVNGGINANTVSVAGNTTIGGILKINSGSPGDGKVLTSDAAGNATWEKTAYANKERFQFNITRGVSLNGPNNSSSTYYNLGTATFSGSAGSGTFYNMNIVITTPGLYHFDTNLYSYYSGSSDGDATSLEINDLTNNKIISLSTQKFAFDLGSGGVVGYSASIDKSLEIYIGSAKTLAFTFRSGSSLGGIKFNTLTVTGHLIAE